MHFGSLNLYALGSKKETTFYHSFDNKNGTTFYYPLDNRDEATFYYPLDNKDDAIFYHSLHNKDGIPSPSQQRWNNLKKKKLLHRSIFLSGF
jgi:hypothetical protein